MAIPTFVNVGTSATSAAAITPGLPASIAANDILIYIAETELQTLTVDGVWTAAPESPISCSGAATETRLFVWYHRYDGANSPSTTTNDSGDHQTGQIAAYRGCVTTGDPFDVTSSGNSTTNSTALSITGDTTTVADCLVIAAASFTTNVTSGSWANTDLSDLNERIDVGTGGGSAGAIALVEGGKAAAGSYGATTATLSGNARKAFWTGALKPAAGTDTVHMGFIPI